MAMNLTVVNSDNPHPKDLSKSPAVAGVFVCGIVGRFVQMKICTLTY